MVVGGFLNVVVGMESSEDTLLESLLSFYHGGPKEQTQLFRSVKQTLLPTRPHASTGVNILNYQIQKH